MWWGCDQVLGESLEYQQLLDVRAVPIGLLDCFPIGYSVHIAERTPSPANKVELSATLKDLTNDMRRTEFH